MPNAGQQQVVSDAARKVIADMAPQELALFRPLSQAFFKDPDKTLKGGGGSDKMLGFGGMASIGSLLTPAVLQSTQVALDSFVNGFSRHINRELEHIESFLGDAADRPATATSSVAIIEAPATAAPHVTPPEVLDQVHAIVMAQLQQLNAPPEQCDELAQRICAMFSDGKLAEDCLAREHDLHRQVQELKIELNHAQRTKEVEQIVGSDYFNQIRDRAVALRQQAGKA